MGNTNFLTRIVEDITRSRHISIWFVILVFQNFTVFGEISQENDSFLVSYYHHVYNAENCIVKKDYQCAIENYKIAFASGLFPFSTDIYNCAVCAAELKEYKIVDECARDLVLRGADSTFFTAAIFLGFRQSACWPNFAQSFDSLRSVCKKVIDYSMKCKLMLLDSIDQSKHCLLRLNSSKENFVTEMHRQDDSLNEALMNDLFSRGYIDERQIGGNFMDTFLSPYPVFYEIILHGFENNSRLFESVIDSAIHNGLIRPEVGLTLLAMGGVNIKFADDYFILDDTLRRWNVLRAKTKIEMLASNPRKEEIEKRAYYNLDSLPNILAKIKFNHAMFLTRRRGDASLPFVLLPHVNVSNLRSPIVYNHSVVVCY